MKIVNLFMGSLNIVGDVTPEPGKAIAQILMGNAVIGSSGGSDVVVPIQKSSVYSGGADWNEGTAAKIGWSAVTPSIIMPDDFVRVGTPESEVYLAVQYTDGTTGVLKAAFPVTDGMIVVSDFSIDISSLATKAQVEQVINLIQGIVI